MELCKTDTNMSLEMNGAGLSQQGEPLVPLVPIAQGEVVMPPASAMASNGHLKCTCLPSIAASEIDEKMKDIVEAEAASMALAEVSTASHNSKVTFNDEIQVVREEIDPEEDDDMIDLAEALYAAGVGPELLAAISEEDIFHPEDGVLSDEDLASGLHDEVDEEALGLMWSEYEPQLEEVILTNDRLPPPPGQSRLFPSLSEPDLLSIKLPHPSSRPILSGGHDPSHSTAVAPVKRQRTWHQFNKPIIRNSLKSETSTPQAAVQQTDMPAAIQELEDVMTSNQEATSFV